MVLIWKGKGIYVLIIFGIVSYLHYLLFVNDPNAKVVTSKGLAIPLFVTGIICFFLSKSWKGKTQFDAKKKKEIIVRADHSFFYINVYYWSFILMALGMFCFYNIWKSS